jgi:hypothetical protein
VQKNHLFAFIGVAANLLRGMLAPLSVSNEPVRLAAVIWVPLFMPPACAFKPTLLDVCVGEQTRRS